MAPSFLSVSCFIYGVWSIYEATPSWKNHIISDMKGNCVLQSIFRFLFEEEERILRGVERNLHQYFGYVYKFCMATNVPVN